jgi:hypothetical protein
VRGLIEKKSLFVFINPMKAEGRETQSRQSVPQTRKKFKLDRINPHLAPENVSLRTTARIIINPLA